MSILVFLGSGVATGVYRYIYPKNQSTLQIFMWLLVVFFSLTQDKLLLISKLEWLVKIYTPPNEIPGYAPDQAVRVGDATASFDCSKMDRGWVGCGAVRGGEGGEVCEWTVCVWYGGGSRWDERASSDGGSSAHRAGVQAAGRRRARVWGDWQPSTTVRVTWSMLAPHSVKSLLSCSLWCRCRRFVPTVFSSRVCCWHLICPSWVER